MVQPGRIVPTERVVPAERVVITDPAELEARRVELRRVEAARREVERVEAERVEAEEVARRAVAEAERETEEWKAARVEVAGDMWMLIEDFEALTPEMQRIAKEEGVEALSVEGLTAKQKFDKYVEWGQIDEDSEFVGEEEGEPTYYTPEVIAERERWEALPPEEKFEELVEEGRIPVGAEFVGVGIVMGPPAPGQVVVEKGEEGKITYYTPEQVAEREEWEAAHVEGAAGKWVTREDYEDMSPEAQEVFRTQGLETLTQVAAAEVTEAEVATSVVAPYKTPEGYDLVAAIIDRTQKLYEYDPEIRDWAISGGERKVTDEQLSVLFSSESVSAARGVADLEAEFLALSVESQHDILRGAGFDPKVVSAPWTKTGETEAGGYKSLSPGNKSLLLSYYSELEGKIFGIPIPKALEAVVEVQVPKLQAALEVAVPIYGTVKYWDELSTPWKVASIALDALIVLPAIKYAGSTLSTVTKRAITGVRTPKATVETVLTHGRTLTDDAILGLSEFEAKTGRTNIVRDFKAVADAQDTYVRDLRALGDAQDLVKTIPAQFRAEAEMHLTAMQRLVEADAPRLKTAMEEWVRNVGGTGLYDDVVFLTQLEELQTFVKSLKAGSPYLKGVRPATPEMLKELGTAADVKQAMLRGTISVDAPLLEAAVKRWTGFIREWELLEDLPKTIVKQTESLVESLRPTAEVIARLEGRLTTARTFLRAAQEKWPTNASKWIDLAHDANKIESDLMAARAGSVEVLHRQLTRIVDNIKSGKLSPKALGRATVERMKVTDKLNDAIRRMEVDWPVEPIPRIGKAVLTETKVLPRVGAPARPAVAAAPRLGLAPAVSVIARPLFMPGALEITAPLEMPAIEFPAIEAPPLEFPMIGVPVEVPAVVPAEVQAVEIATEAAVNAAVEAASKAQAAGATAVEISTAAEVAAAAAVEAAAEAATEPAAESAVRTATETIVKQATETATRRFIPFIPPPPPEKKKKEVERLIYPEDSVTWRQGLSWIVIKPPYAATDMEWTDRPPEGVYRADVGKPSETVEGPDVTFTVPVGMFDATYSRGVLSYSRQPTVRISPEEEIEAEIDELVEGMSEEEVEQALAELRRTRGPGGTPTQRKKARTVEGLAGMRQ